MSRWGPASLASGVDRDGLKTLRQAGARMVQLPDKTVTVVTLTGDEHLREYNRRYRGVDEPTDVLAFAAREKPSDQRFQAPPGTEDWLGDIVISLPRARRQAREPGIRLTVRGGWPPGTAFSLLSGTATPDPPAGL